MAPALAGNGSRADNSIDGGRERPYGPPPLGGGNVLAPQQSVVYERFGFCFEQVPVNGQMQPASNRAICPGLMKRSVIRER